MESERKFDFILLVTASAACVASASYCYDVCFCYNATGSWKKVYALLILACSSPLVAILLVAGGASISITSMLLMYMYAFFATWWSDARSMPVQARDAPSASREKPDVISE